MNRKEKGYLSVGIASYKFLMNTPNQKAMNNEINLDTVLDDLDINADRPRIKQAMTEAVRQALSIAAEKAKIDKTQSYFDAHNKLQTTIDKSSILDIIKLIK